MARLDLTDALKTLRGERAQAQKKLTKLDKAIAVIRELTRDGANPEWAPQETDLMSAAARKKIAKAQKLRWAKFRERKKAKG